MPARAARYLVRTLLDRDDDHAHVVAEKIRRAMQVEETTIVELEVFEDEDVLSAIPRAAAHGHGGRELGQLERALRAKNERETPEKP